jgi:hypothetical protein
VWEEAGVLSSRNLSALPAPDELECRCQAMGLLVSIDAIAVTPAEARSV